MSLVLELQKDALNLQIPVSSLLRKAYVIAKKLNIHDAIVWVELELNGYRISSIIPEYRKVRGSVKFFDPSIGWQPIIFESPEEGESLSDRRIPNAVDVLENIIEQSKNFIIFGFSKEVETQFFINSGEFQAQPKLLVSCSVIFGIIQRVRSIVLDWTLTLEQQGITGRDMTFSDEEKHTATLPAVYIEKIINQGPHSQLQMGTNCSSQSLTHEEIDPEKLQQFIDLVASEIGKIKLAASQVSEIHANVETIKEQLLSPSPKQSVLRECLISIRNILEGAAGSAISSGLLHQIAGFTL